MERKTKVHAEPNKQELFITRNFELPVELLFKAYTEAEIVAQWMSTRVLKLENKTHGGWAFETADKDGNVVFKANGVIHEFIPNQKIVRTFEMNNAPFGAQLEFLEFKALSETSSQLSIQIIYRSMAVRDQVLQLPFAQGINMAHNRLEEIVHQLNS
jgi:uncharacterized protein YndB with AHSA1/START domain